MSKQKNKQERSTQPVKRTYDSGNNTESKYGLENYQNSYPVLVHTQTHTPSPMKHLWKRRASTAVRCNCKTPPTTELSASWSPCTRCAMVTPKGGKTSDDRGERGKNKAEKTLDFFSHRPARTAYESRQGLTRAATRCYAQGVPPTVQGFR